MHIDLRILPVEPCRIDLIVHFESSLAAEVSWNGSKCPHCRHLCKSKSREKTRGLWARSWGRALRRSGSFTAHKCLSAGGPCRTGHPFAVSGSKSRHRRLSWCSLPVPKQSVGAWDLIPRPVGNRRDLAACAFMNPNVFLSL